MDKRIKGLLDIAAELIATGKSTTDTAFIDAINLDNNHCYGFINAMNAQSAPQPQPLTGYNEVYAGMITELSSKTYNKILNG